MRTFFTTATKEDYLRALFHLEEEDIGDVTLTSLARYLRLSKSTVSERLRELEAQKLISYPKYGKLDFTPRGRRIARSLTRKHRIAEVFLHKTLGMPKHKVHAEAHKLEHAMSDEVASRLSALLGDPELDPHGMPIPS